MHTTITDYTSPGEFAKQYTSKRTGQQGVSRAYIGELIQQERTNPGSTGLDVLEIAGQYFVRYTPTNSQDAKPPKGQSEPGQIIAGILSKV